MFPGLKVQVFKKQQIHDFIFFQKYQYSNIIYLFLKKAVCIRSFNVNYSNTTQSCLSHCST